MLRVIVVGLMGIGLVVTSLGWYESSQKADSEPFALCRWQGDALVLSYDYGANAETSISVDTRQQDVVVSLTSQQGEGAAPAIGLSGEASFTIFGGPLPVRDQDGGALPCPRG